MAGVSIRNLTARRSITSRIAVARYANVARAIVPSWDISLVFVGPARARILNRSLRKKSYTPNVLSYVVGEKNGEIIICPSALSPQISRRCNVSISDSVLLLFIHGVLHLEGRVHGVTMERWERKLLRQYAGTDLRTLIHGQAHRNRHRHRHVPGKTGRR